MGCGHERHGGERRCCPRAARSSCSATTCAARCASPRSRSYKTAFVWSHDSVGVGEDGPTHQPIEQLAALRAMPGLRRDPPGRRQRGRAGVARAHRRRRPDRARSSPARSVPVLEGTAERAPEGVPRGRVRARRRGRRRPRPRAHRHRLRGVAVRRGARAARRRRATRCASCRCRRGTCSPRRPTSTATRCCPPDVPTLAVEAGATLRLGALRRRRRRRSTASARRRPGRRCMTELGYHARERRRARARALLEQREELDMTSAIARAQRLRAEPLVRQPRPRRCCTDGGLAQLVDDDGIRGVTSNPTILDKAIAAGEGYDEQLAACARDGPVDRGHVLGARRSTTSSPPPTCCGRCTTRPTAATASCRSRCRPSSRTTPTARSRQAQVAVRARRPART